MYQDPSGPGASAGPPQGQRCAACGHVEADVWARFCGVCGGTLGQAAAGPAGRAPGPTAGSPAYPPSPPAGPVFQQSPAIPAAPGAAYQASAAGSGAPVVYTIPSIGFGGPARIGAAVGAAFMLLPCVLFAFAGVALIHRSRELLDSWRNATIPVPVPLVTVNLNMNFIDLLNLHEMHDRLVYWDERLWLAFALLWLVPWIVLIVAGALFGVLMALIYNLIARLGGGMRVTLQPSALRSAGPSAATSNWQQPSGQPGWPTGPAR